MEYGTGRGKGRGGTKRRVFKTEKERKQHQLEYNREWKRINGQRKCESGDKPVLKKTTGKFFLFMGRVSRSLLHKFNNLQ